MFEDATFWLFVAPGLLLGLYAQARIKANYVRYARVGTSGHLPGAQVARALLDASGLQNVRIDSTPGMLSDHYDPQSKTLRLSPEVYYTPSLAAAGIA
ncbi:MAG: zinc metallopeptidase, partial [Hyphomicrobiaceae bacterium]